MQVVFVHGVNTRDLGDGDYEKWVAGRTDRLVRLAFGGNATVRNPYWGQFGLARKTLKSFPREKGGAAPLEAPAPEPGGKILTLARSDFSEAIATLSVAAISHATVNLAVDERRAVEDFWLAAAKLADVDSPPLWLNSIRSDDELLAKLAVEISADTAEAVHVDRQINETWRPSLPRFDANAFVASKARELIAGHLAQFLGDALMFFSRREQSLLVRKEVCASIIEAAVAAHEKDEPLVLIGYSMGGGVLHEILSDPEVVAGMEAELGRQLEVGLFLSVGTQIGMFAELRQFATQPGGEPLAVPVKHYWNVFDYNDTLAFLCAPVVPGAVDLEISTSANVAAAHGAYFESALFFARLKARLKGVGLLRLP